MGDYFMQYREIKPQLIWLKGKLLRELESGWLAPDEWGIASHRLITVEKLIEKGHNENHPDAEMSTAEVQFFQSKEFAPVLSIEEKQKRMEVARHQENKGRERHPNERDRDAHVVPIFNLSLNANNNDSDDESLRQPISTKVRAVEIVLGRLIAEQKWSNKNPNLYSTNELALLNNRIQNVEKLLEATKSGSMRNERHHQSQDQEWDKPVVSVEERRARLEKKEGRHMLFSGDDKIKPKGYDSRNQNNNNNKRKDW